MIILGIIVILFLLNFYRTPSPRGKFMINEIISPCYGTVTNIEKIENNTHITWFLSPLDIHMQYCPVSGFIHTTNYDRTGKFYLAYNASKSRLNEKRIHVIQSIWGPITLIQVAGFLTRRIESWVTPDQDVNAGQPIGFIHLGSRVDLILPSNGLTLEISKHNKVKGGCQRIGYYGTL